MAVRQGALEGEGLARAGGHKGLTAWDDDLLASLIIP